MALLDRYILFNWLRAFMLAFVVMLSLLLMIDFYDDVQDLLNFGATPAELIRYYAASTPSYVPTVLPMALLLSVLFSLGKLHRTNEVTAMRATGLGRLGISRMVFVASLLLAAALFYLNSSWVPQSIEQTRQMRENLEFGHQIANRDAQDVGLIHNLTFDNYEGKRMWFINRYSQYTGEGFGITVSLFSDDGNELQRLVATEGYFDEGKGYWILRMGREISFDPKTGDPVRSLPFERKEYAQLNESPGTMKLLEKEPKNLSYNELLAILAILPTEDDPRTDDYAVRAHNVLANPFSCLIIVGLATPLAIRGVRINPMVGVAKAVGLFFLYYLLERTSLFLGGQGTVEPMLAAWLPNAIMTGIAVTLFLRSQ